LAAADLQTPTQTWLTSEVHKNIIDNRDLNVWVAYWPHQLSFKLGNIGMNLEWGDRCATYYYGSNDGSTELQQSLVWKTQQTR